MSEVVPVASRDHKLIIATVLAVLAVIAATVLAVTHLQPTAKDSASITSPGPIFGHAVQLPHQIALTVSRPEGDGNGHLVVYLTEASNGPHAYSTMGQRVRFGNQTLPVDAHLYGMVYPGEEATYRLAFRTDAGDAATADVTVFPAHGAPITWAAR